MTETLTQKIEEALSRKKLSWSDIESAVVHIRSIREEDTKLMGSAEARALFDQFSYGFDPFVNKVFIKDCGSEYISFNLYTKDWIFTKAESANQEEEMLEYVEYVFAVPRNPTREVEPGIPGPDE